LKNGKGKYTFSNGEIYEGNWKDGQFIEEQRQVISGKVESMK